MVTDSLATPSSKAVCIAPHLLGDGFRSLRSQHDPAFGRFWLRSDLRFQMARQAVSATAAFRQGMVTESQWKIDEERLAATDGKGSTVRPALD